MKRDSLIKKGEWHTSVNKKQKKGVPKYISKEAGKPTNDYDPTERWDVDNASWDCGESVYE